MTESKEGGKGIHLTTLYEEANALRKINLPHDVAGTHGVRRLLELQDDMQHRRGETTRLKGLIEPRILTLRGTLKYEEKAVLAKIRVHASEDEGIKESAGSREEREAHATLAFFEQREGLFKLRMELAGLEALKAFVEDVRDDIDAAQQTLRKEVDLAGIEVRLTGH